MTFVSRILLAGFIAACLQSAASAQTPARFKAESNGQINFVMPSKNVGCTFTPAGGTSVYQPQDGGPELSCDRVKPTYARVSLTPKNVRRYTNVGDQDGFPETNTFAYGTKWTQGPFACESATSGLTCRRSDGKGFAINQATIKVLE